MLRGPDPERDGVSTWRAKDLCAIVEDGFEIVYSENAMLRLLHDLDLSWQKTRLIQGPGALQQKFAGLITEIARDHLEADRLEIWFLDEARVRPDRPRLPALVRARPAP